MTIDSAQRSDEDRDEGAPEGPQISFLDLLTWLGDGKKFIAGLTATAAVVSLAYTLTLKPIYTARTSLLPPSSQQPSGSTAALAALGSLGGLAGGLGVKTSDELYVALLRSESVTRALDERFGLKGRYEIKTNEALRQAIPQYIRVSSEKKTGVISIEVDDEDPAFAASLANAHVGEVTKVLSRLAVSEAQQRRLFFDQQVKETKEKLVKAESDLQRVQKQSGVFVLDKQAEALVTSAAQVRTLIAEREVQLRVLRNSSTERNPDVIRLLSEIGALRSELTRMESSQGRPSEGTLDMMTMGKIPEAAIEYVRARRELKLQETLLEAMVRQFEMAKLDEAKDGPLLQQIDSALPPDRKSKPSRAKIVLASTLLTMLVAAIAVVLRRYAALSENNDPNAKAAWSGLKKAWRLRL